MGFIRVSFTGVYTPGYFMPRLVAPEAVLLFEVAGTPECGRELRNVGGTSGAESEKNVPNQGAILLSVLTRNMAAPLTCGPIPSSERQPPKIPLTKGQNTFTKTSPIHVNQCSHFLPIPGFLRA